MSSSLLILISWFRFLIKLLRDAFLASFFPHISLVLFPLFCIRKWQQIEDAQKVAIRDDTVSAIGEGIAEVAAFITEIDLQDNLLWEWKEVRMCVCALKVIFSTMSSTFKHCFLIVILFSGLSQWYQQEKYYDNEMSPTLFSSSTSSLFSSSTSSLFSSSTSFLFSSSTSFLFSSSTSSLFSSGDSSHSFMSFVTSIFFLSQRLRLPVWPSSCLDWPLCCYMVTRCNKSPKTLSLSSLGESFIILIPTLFEILKLFYVIRNMRLGKKSYSIEYRCLNMMEYILW